jgi:CubicO group peptidase (beta-lactamase class C family)
LLLLPLAGLTAQVAPPVADLAESLAPIRARYSVPALGALVLVDGDVAAIGVTGVRRQGKPEVVTVDDQWHLGSCTKAMTATLLATQVEAGEMKWARTMGEALPDLESKMNEQARAITVQQLLQHRAGLPPQPPSDLWRKLFKYEGTDADARTEVAATLLAAAPEAKPGERYLYSNASYMVAGAVSERAGGKPWEELMRERLFAPLGMESAGFGPPGSEGSTSQPWGHHPGKDAPQPAFADNPPSLGPAGTVHCSLRDWARFAALHLGRLPANGEPLLRTSSLVTLHTPPRGGEYALGWIVTEREWAPGPILTHAGSNTMWYCVAWLAPQAQFGVLVVCNQGESARACDEVAAACIERFAPNGRGKPGRPGAAK